MKKSYSVLLLLFLCGYLSTLSGAQRGVARAGGALDSTWTDPATGLMWSKTDNGSDVDWNQATAYCSNLQLAGYSGWRLPTIEELQRIDDPGTSAQATFDSGVSVVHVKGNLKLTGWQWSSSQGGAPGRASNGPWTFNFTGGTRGDSFPIGFSYSMRALCVRHS